MNKVDRARKPGGEAGLDLSFAGRVAHVKPMAQMSFSSDLNLVNVESQTCRYTEPLYTQDN